MKEYWDTLTVLKKIKFSISIILFIFIILFVFQNWKEENVNMLFFDLNIPLSLVIACSIFIGYTISTFLKNKEIAAKDEIIKRLHIDIEALEEKE
jgi:uncharacterized integral membrane protein